MLIIYSECELFQLALQSCEQRPEIPMNDILAQGK